MIENSMCYIHQEPLIEIDYRKEHLIKEEKYYSILTIGNIKIRNTKKFNWFQRKMFKLVFGIKIENIK